MSKLFSVDNKFFSAMGKLFDLMILGILWLLCSVGGILLSSALIGEGIVQWGTGWGPDRFLFLVVLMLSASLILAVGPASTAFYYTVVKVIRRERSYILKEFFRSFKLNFRQGVIVTVIYAVVVFLMYFDVNYAIQLNQEGSKYGSVMFGVFIVQAVLVLFTIVYIFPLLSRFTVTLKHLFKWAFFLSVRHFASTLLLLLLFVATAVMMYFSFLYMPFLDLFLPGIYTLVASFPIEKIFKKYMPKEEEDDEESGIDHWYNE
ncbi:MAG: YesL family protein [Lachnospiraceae bacterium]|nr:YesL family protein [Lachnospiraceae bacterium]